MFCQSLKTTSQDVFHMIKDFFTKYQLDIGRIGLLCSDGPPAMLGNRSEFAALVKKEIPDLKFTHCFLHRHALPAKILLPRPEENFGNLFESREHDLWSRSESPT